MLEIPEHRLLRPIASGSYGQVWLAETAIGTLRAVKIVRRDRFERAEDFEREFRGLQRFEPISRTHEALVDILQIGRQEDWFYYVMELADSAEKLNAEGPAPPDERNPKPEKPSVREPAWTSPFGHRFSDVYSPHTLRAELKARSSLGPDEVIALGQRLSSALAHLHAHGLVHRDVKPSNILFVKGLPKLADAGLVASVDDARSLVGTAGYIPPEGPGSPQADIYSLGKVLYEATFGKDRQEFPKLPPDLAIRQDHIRLLELNEVITKACAPDPRLRYPHAQSMLAEIESLGRGESVRLRRRLSQRYALLKKASLTVVSFVAIGAVAVLVSGRVPKGEFHSKVPGVDALVAAGVQCGTSLTFERLEEARNFFEQAAQLDRKFPPALIGLFRTRVLQYSGSSPAPDDSEAKLRTAATNLIVMAPELAEARLASSYLCCLGGNWPEAIAQARAATRMPVGSGPDGVAMVHGFYGWYLLNVGEMEAALREFRIADAARPADLTIQMHLGQPYRAWRKFDQALAYYQKSIAIEPRQCWSYQCIGTIYEDTGEIGKAIDMFEKADIEGRGMKPENAVFYNELRKAFKQGGKEAYFHKRLEYCSNNTPPDFHGMAIYHAMLGETTPAYECLEKACDRHELQGLWFDLCWDHNDPHFKAIARKLKLHL